MYGNKPIIGYGAFFVIFLLIAVSFSSAQQQLSDEAIQSSLLITSAEDILSEMEESGFSVEQVKDKISAAKQLFYAQVALENQGGEPDFTMISDLVNEIIAIKNTAYDTWDQLSALEQYIIDLESSDDIDFSTVIEILDQAKTEFNKERYDMTITNIDNAYKEISRIQSENTAAFVVYKATTQTITTFLKDNWMYISVTVVVLVVVLVITRNKISRFKIRRNINRLKSERRVLEDLIKTTQHEYFKKKTLAEEVYNIRTNKFSEMIRDIDRRVPLLIEQIEKTK